MIFLSSIPDFMGQVIVATLYQFFAIFGFILLFGLLLYFISRSTRNAFTNSEHGKLDIYLTGWIGTPVHEIGHAIFCVLFGHRIIGISLYNPNSIDGTLGYVNHSYNPESLYQRIGFFFIGSGPILFGSFVLYALMYYCLPNYREVSAMISHTNLTGTDVFDLMISMKGVLTFGINLTVSIFAIGNLGNLSFWIFIYLSFCISSHMQLSPPDLKSMWTGLFAILFIFMVINLITLLLGFNITSYILNLSRFLGTMIGIFILAFFISFINFSITYILLSIFHYRKYKRLLSIL
jgi:hypothetical protein